MTHFLKDTLTSSHDAAENLKRNFAGENLQFDAI